MGEELPVRGTQAIQRAVALLREAAVKTSGGWRLGELAARCAIDRTTAYRILKCLVAEGLLARSADGQRYRLGSLAFELGLAASPAMDLRALCADALTRCAATCGDTVFLNIRSGSDSVCFDRREGTYPVKALTVEIGARRPLSASAGGLAMLMLLPAAERARIMRENAGRLAATTRLRPQTLNALLEDSRRAGYGLNRGRVVPGVVAVAVAIRSGDGEPLAALSVAAISERMSATRLREIVPMLARECSAIESHITPGERDGTGSNTQGRA